ncbi:hypothetical protein GHT06_019772 [Daphnia sinensis]|uniref:Carboxylic ester hydrolase n=1 Tax=Daphnia sinensis TaxID=1820382 RepID=A0AAD5KL80_9CRUS|nr:hypothetical protein GHT06_019772 [Daphnia sinensis]
MGENNSLLCVVICSFVMMFHWPCCCSQQLASAHRLGQRPMDNITVLVSDNRKDDGVSIMGPFVPYQETHQWKHEQQTVFQEGERIRRDESSSRNGGSSSGGNKGRPGNIDDTNSRLLVQTLNGRVRGTTKTALGETVDVFLGIPFAKPPLGNLRFKKPVPIDPWQGVYDAQSLPNSCQQERYDVFPGFRGEEMWNPNTPISEDCLYLNLWVPTKLRNANNNNSGNGTVLIWIYGGGYMSGTSTLEVYDALILAATNDIIVVSINYRVGVFGFLYLDHEDAPGNMGLYDQALAIKWIKDNIRSFGGDPNSLTLFGESAGAGSVSVHLLSPVSGHLARRAIMQSGSVNAPWSYMTAETSKKIAVALVNDVGCNSSMVGIDTPSVMECMRSVQAKNLSLIQWNSYWGILGFPSAPTIDGVFLPKHPKDMLKEGGFSDAEILVGTNQDEGTYFILYDFIQYFKKDDPSVLEREKFLEIINTIFKTWSQLEREAIIFQYTDWDHIENGYLNQKMIGDVVGDYYFTCPTNYFAQKFAEHGTNVYYYHFTQRSSTNPWGQWMGVMHADEVEYVFGHPLNMSRDYTASERELSRRVMKYFATFAKTGKPVADDTLWPIYSRNEPRYFILNGEVRGIGHGPRATACAFWNEFMPLITARQSTNQCDPDAMLSLRGSASTIPKSSGCRGIFPVMLCWLLMAVLKVV